MTTTKRGSEAMSGGWLLRRLSRLSGSRVGESALAAPGVAGSGGAEPRIVARRYQPHFPGLVYVILTVLLVLGAVNSQNNLLFAIFGLAVAGIVISGVVSGAAIMGLRITRQVVGPVEAGREARVLYRIRNTNWWLPSAGLVIEEMPHGRRRRHASTWPEHVGTIAAFVPWLKAHEEVVVEGRARAHSRGPASLDLVRVSTTFPFGLTRKCVDVSQRATLLVRPWTAPVTRGALGKAVGGDAEPRSRRVARGVDGEFFSIRDYASGDSPRSIAWRASARRGHLVVRETSERDYRRLVFEVDVGTTAGMDRERFLSAVAGLAAAELAEGVELTLECGTTQVHPGQGSRQRDRVLDALAQLPRRDGSGGAGRLTIRSLDGGEPAVLSSVQVAALVSQWGDFPVRATAVEGGPQSLWARVRRNFV